MAMLGFPDAQIIISTRERPATEIGALQLCVASVILLGCRDTVCRYAAVHATGSVAKQFW